LRTALRSSCPFLDEPPDTLPALLTTRVTLEAPRRCDTRVKGATGSD
jgi:hypothetical protein